MILEHYSHIQMHLPRRHTKSRFFIFLLPQFFLLFADSILVFTFPIFLAQELGSAILVGAVLSVSGIASIFFDVLFPGLFRNLSWRAQLVYSILLAMLFTLSLHAFILAAPLFLVVFASVIRGAYREIMFFVRDEAIATEEPKQEYIRDYSILSICVAVLLVTGAMLGTYLVGREIEIHTLTLLGILGVALILALIIARLFKSKKQREIDLNTSASVVQTRKGLSLTLHEWRLLTLPAIAPLCMGALASWIIILHLSFGGLFLLSLSTGTIYAWTVTLIYNSAFLGVALILLFAGNGTLRNGKKKTSQYAMIAAGMFLIPISLFAQNISLVLLLISFSCIFFAIAAIFNQAVFANIAERLDSHKLSFISLQNIWGSSAVIIAPLVIGYLIDTYGFYVMYSLTGIGIFVTTIILRSITPKKIHLPQSELRS